MNMGGERRKEEREVKRNRHDANRGGKQGGRWKKVGKRHFGKEREREI